MCGIAGFTGHSNQGLLRQMTQCLVHRGPDESGFYEEGNLVSLGHRRLSIIDLATGRQPLLSADGNVCVSYNGEIYNFLDLKQQLEAFGYRFRTKTDTEVIVYAYIHYGVRCFEKFNGMFAFSLWDKKKKTLYLVRDRFGIKPLYYTRHQEELFFASEIRALLKVQNISRELNPQAMVRYFSFRYIPGEQSIYRSIKKVLPGQYVTFHNGSLKIETYWDLMKTQSNTNAQKRSVLNAAKQRALMDEFSSVFCDVVQKCLISDVPVGLFLSGGVDSTSLVAQMSHLGHKPIRTFSIGFDLPKIDELKEAKRVSQYFNTDHCEYILTPKDLDVLPQIINSLDEPNADSIMIPLYWLCKHASSSVKVVLSGEGGDEIFGGYFYQKKLLKLAQWGNLVPQFVLDALARVIGRLPVSVLDLSFEYSQSMGEAGKKRLVELLKNAHSPYRMYRTVSQLFSSEELNALLNPDLLRAKSFDDSIEKNIEAISSDVNHLDVDKIILREMKYWLSDYILNRQDKISMAHSLEMRVPYLDHRLLELLLSLPSQLKQKNMEEKYLLKKTVRSLYPKHPFFKKKKKKAFFLPFEGRFRKPFDQWIKDYLDPAELKKDGIINAPFVENLKKKENKSPLLYQKQLMALVVWQIWRRNLE